MPKTLNITRLFRFHVLCVSFSWTNGMLCSENKLIKYKNWDEVWCVFYLLEMPKWIWFCWFCSVPDHNAWNAITENIFVARLLVLNNNNFWNLFGELKYIYNKKTDGVNGFIISWIYSIPGFSLSLCCIP